MRSTEYTQNSPDGAVTKRFGALITQLAERAGYDPTSGTGGRAALARDIGSMSPSAVGRMLDGKTLPMPHQLEAIARVIHADVRELLVSAGVISANAWPKGANTDVLSTTSAPSQPPSPEAAADMWGITEPGIRDMLIGNVRQAIRLQNELNSRNADRGGAAVRR
jgi:hypothetical protein